MVEIGQEFFRQAGETGGVGGVRCAEWQGDGSAPAHGGQGRCQVVVRVLRKHGVMLREPGRVVWHEGTTVPGGKRHADDRIPTTDTSTAGEPGLATRRPRLVKAGDRG